MVINGKQWRTLCSMKECFKDRVTEDIVHEFKVTSRTNNAMELKQVKTGPQMNQIML